MGWKPTFAADPSDEAFILERLSRVTTIYIALPARIETAFAMRQRGLVTCQWGSGRDQGFLLVQKAREPRSWHPAGGSAA